MIWKIRAEDDRIISDFLDLDIVKINFNYLISIWMLIVQLNFLLNYKAIYFFVLQEISFEILGTIIYKSPLENIEIIAPNIYIIDIGGYFNLFFYKCP